MSKANDILGHVRPISRQYVCFSRWDISESVKPRFDRYDLNIQNKDSQQAGGNSRICHCEGHPEAISRTTVKRFFLDKESKIDYIGRKIDFTKPSAFQTLRKHRISKPQPNHCQIMPKLSDVAHHAGVSPATVSRVLNGLDRVSPETSRRVLNSLRELRYKPSRVARRLRIESNKSHILGLIIPDIQNPFFAEVARGVEDVAYAHEYAVLLCNSDESTDKENFYLETLRSEYVDGIILPPVDERDEAVAHLLKNNIAVVCVDRSVSTIPVDTVEVGNQNGAYEATELLIKLGHRRIGFVSGRPNISTTRERRQGYEAALAAHAITIDERLIRVGDSKSESGRVLTGELLDLPERPTGLFICNNLMTLGALVAIHQRRLRIPNDIALVGFDDFAWAESLDPPLTVVRQPAYQVGRKAAELLLQRLADPRREPSRIRLVPELIIRRSCGSPEKRDEGAA